MSAFFTPNALAVAAKAKEVAKKLNYTDAGREHLLFGFASGAGGETIKLLFERFGLGMDAVLSAIEYIDGPLRPLVSKGVNYVHTVSTLTEPFIIGIRSITANQIFVGLTPNADQVFQMARLESGEQVSAEDILRIFLREIGRSDLDRRVMQVIHRAAPDLDFEVMRHDMLTALDSVTEEV